MKIKFEDLPKGLKRRAKAVAPHADKILYMEEYDPTHGGYVETYEKKRYRVVFEWQGKEYTATITQGTRDSFY